MQHPSTLTGFDNYFEDFSVGCTFRHARGKTISHLENVLVTHLVMNTAQAHFNEHEMRNTSFGELLSFGGVQLAIVLGLSSQDCCENAISEVGLNNVRFLRPVAHGTTLYAVTQVIDKRDAGQTEAGLVTFRHWGLDGDEHIVLVVDRCVSIRRKHGGATA